MITVYVVILRVKKKKTTTHLNHVLQRKVEIKLYENYTTFISAFNAGNFIKIK